MSSDHWKLHQQDLFLFKNNHQNLSVFLKKNNPGKTFKTQLKLEFLQPYTAHKKSA